MRSNLRAVLFALLWALVVPGPVAAEDIESATRTVAKQLQCPICESVNVADSPSDLAVQMRGVIRAKLEDGETPAQILEYFVARYGDGILTEPPRRGVSLLVWMGPILGVVLGALILARRLQRITTTTDNSSPAATDPDPRVATAVRELAELRGGPKP